MDTLKPGGSARKGRAAMRIGMLGFALVLAMVSMLVGCGSSTPVMGQYDIEVSLAPELAANPPALTVDIVGASSANYAELSAKDPKAWFAGGDVNRANTTKLTTVFGPGDTGSKLLKRRDKAQVDAAWKTWRDMKATKIFVFVNLPRDGSIRKIELPLDRKRWKPETIKLEINAGGVRSTNGPEPEAVR